MAKLVFLDIAIDWKEFIIPQTVPNNPIKGAVEPTVAKKVKPLSILSICFSIPFSNKTVILSLKLDLDFFFNRPSIAFWKTNAIGSWIFEGRLL